MISIVTATYKAKLLFCCTGIFLISTYTLRDSHVFYRFRPYPVRQHPQTILQVPRDISISEALLTTGIANRKSSSHTQEELDEHVGEPYFEQAGDGEVLVHYDRRYFLGAPVSDEERRLTLHHMIRAYTSTFRKHNLQTWIAHGTLLGFWWNARILPWDMDIDVQVPESVLFRLRTQFNMTTFDYLETEDRNSDIDANELRQYILDVNPNIDDREKGWGDNVIDARFIDTSNGLYIDITGISELHSDDEDNSARIWVCKNNHHYHENDIWPLRETIFEGVVTSIPARYEAILTGEYGLNALMSTRYHGHQWSVNDAKWIEIIEP